MSKTTLRLAGLLALAVLAGCQPDSPELHGRAVFNGYNCKQCHRVGYEGGKLGPDLSYVGFRKSPEFLDRWLSNPSAWKHNTVMPNFHFSPALRKSLVAYLSSLQGQAYEGKKPWDAEEFASDPVKKGGEIFVRAGCITCHGKNGSGGYPNNNVNGGKIPTLTNVADGYTKEELVKKISNGVRHPAKVDPSGEEPLLYMPQWSEKLSPDEIAAVTDYLISLKPGGAKADSW
ncbi:MAG TPA: cytochrome c [Elusimicrobiota bacterium]|nr:cytochrome c [Elusimicrobiota bacterium]